MARRGRLTSIPTPTHIMPTVPGPLVQVQLPEPEGYVRKRELLVPEPVRDQLAQVTDLPKIASVMQRYLAGMYVTGTLQGDPDRKQPDFERLEKVDEVWVMCFRAPHFDQWRLMGRFSAPNVFVGLGLFRRAYLNGKAHYQAQAEAFVSHWSAVVGRAPIQVGGMIEDYISMPVRDPYAPSII